MVNYKEYVAKQFIGKKVHFNCDCIIGIDITGEVIDYEIVNSEILYKLSVNNKIIKIGENTPGLKIEFVYL